MRDVFQASRSNSFHTPAEREILLFCLSKREVSKRKRHPTWRLPGCARQVREPRPGFSTTHPCVGEKESTSLSIPLRACRPRLTAAQGPRVEQRAVVARTIQKIYSKATQSGSRS